MAKDAQHAVEQFLYRQSELLDSKQWHWVLICYAWEVPVAGGLGPLLVPQLWLRRIERQWNEVFRDPAHVDAAAAAALERAILDYPRRVAWVLLFASLIGYGVGAWQLRVFAELPYADVAKILVLGLVTGLIGGLFAFLYLEWLLAPLLLPFSRYEARVPVAGRRIPLYAKMFAGSLTLTLTTVLALGTIFYSRGELILEQQVGERVLVSVRKLAADAGDWVSFGRHFGRDIEKDGHVESAPNMGTSEAPMRGQMKAWAEYMRG